MANVSDIFVYLSAEYVIIYYSVYLLRQQNLNYNNHIIIYVIPASIHRLMPVVV